MLLSKEFTIDPRVYHESTSLYSQDHDVRVLMWDRNNGHSPEEKVDGVSVIRLKNSRAMNVLPNEVMRNPFWWRKAYRAALKMYKNDSFRFDVVHCHDLDTLQIGVWLKKKLGVPLIYDSHEIFGHMIAGSHPKAVAKFAFALEKYLVKQVDSIITVAEPHETYFNTICDKPVTLVRNCKELFIDSYVPSKNDSCRLLYIGSLNEGRFLAEAVEVCSTLENINFKIAGYGRLEERIKELTQEKKATNIEFVGTIPMSQVLSETLHSDIVFCVFDPTKPNNRVGPPNKIFEAMVCGRPVIATKSIYSGDLVERFDMGLTTEYSKESLRKVLLNLRDNPSLREMMGKNALKAAKSEFNWSVQEKKLFSVYSEVNAR